MTTATLGIGMTRRTLYRVEAFAPVAVDRVRRELPQVQVADLAPHMGQRRGVSVIPTSWLRRWMAAHLGDLRRYEGFFDAQRLWTDVFRNLVVNEGLDDSLDKHLKGSGYTAAWYVGLADGTPTPAAADAMDSHGGWAEVTAYDEAVRQTLTLGSVSSQSVDNSASKATFTIDTNSTTIGGAFVTTDDTPGATDGTLYGVGAFSAGDKSLDDDDTLSVTVTLTAAAS